MFLLQILSFVFVALTLTHAAESNSPTVAPAEGDSDQSGTRTKLEQLFGPGKRVRDFEPFVTERGEPALLVLFVTNATDWSGKVKLDEPISCPAEVAGIPLTGTYHVALVINQQLVNEVPIPRRDDLPADAASPELSLPLRNTRFFNECFFGPGPTIDYDDPKSQDVEPTKLIQLADFNGDGHAWEFRVIQDGDACGHKVTLLAGYSAKQRRVILYPILKGKTLAYWHDNFFPNPGKPAISKRRYEWPCGDHGNDVFHVEEFEYNVPIEAWVLTREDDGLCIEFGGTRDPRATPTPTSVQLHVGSAHGRPGDRVTISVSIDPHGADVSGVQSDLPLTWGFFATNCTAQTKDRIFSRFQVYSSGIHALLDGLSEGRHSDRQHFDPLPDGSPLFTCTLEISPVVSPGNYPLEVSGLLVNSEAGLRLRADATQGEIVVLPPPPPEPSSQRTP